MPATEKAYGVNGAFMVFLLSCAIMGFAVFFWSVRIIEAVETWKMVPVMDPEAGTKPPDALPLISVIVPAHNEASTISECVRSVLGQDYPRIELIVVDDRSQDGTSDIVASLTAGKENCRLIRVNDLPSGWTGKCHALHVGVRHAQGSWLAFLDADSRLHEAGLRQTLGMALDRKVGMVTLSPGLILESLWEKALQPVFMGMSAILYPLTKVNDPSSSVASANGMFFMIDREAYRKIGGHTDVRDLAVEDIGIGKRVKALGLGLVFANGNRILRTRMYTTLGEIISGWTRILSASMNYRISAAIKHFVVHSLISLPIMALGICMYADEACRLWPHTWFILPAIPLAQAAVVSYLYYPQIGVPRIYSLFMFVGNVVLVAVLLNIVKKIALNDALQWRGCTYLESRYRPTRLDPQPSSEEALAPVSLKGERV
ncbi:MAG: glycosyltransferase [Pseudomonadota bacterium]